MKSALGFHELGFAFGTGTGSKVIFSTRCRDLALIKAEQSIKVEPLSKGRRVGFVYENSFKMWPCSRGFEGV